MIAITANSCLASYFLMIMFMTQMTSHSVSFKDAKHLFQGPSTALEQPGAHHGKQGNELLCGLTSMTPHTIAYVAIQVCHNNISDFSLNLHLTYDTEQACFAMSLTGTWANIDGLFSYSDFYWQIVGTRL